MRILSALVVAIGMAVVATAAMADPEEQWPRKDSLEAKVYRGSIVFTHYCSLCHGVTAEGNGRAARLYTPRPANLVLSEKNDAYKELIIRRGGEAMGRSQFMPPWGKELTDEQIADVIAYLHSINRYKEEKPEKTE
ncbi:MAG: cytochrome c [Pseudomonadota bacterium]